MSAGWVDELPKLTAQDVLRISNRVDDLVGAIAPRDQYGVPILTRDQHAAIQDFNDWLDKNFGPIE